MPNMVQNAIVLAVFVLWTIFLLTFEIPGDWKRIFNKHAPKASENRHVTTKVHPEYYANIFDHKSHWKKKVFPCFKGIFSDILIVVTYNSPYYDNIKIINQLYSKVFGKVVHCGPAAPKESKHHPDIVADVCGGHCGYVCMTRAIEGNPGYKGYLYVNDDMVVNWWRLLDFDRKKVWQGPEIVEFNQDAYGEIINKEWMWWTYPVGLPACQKSHKDLVSEAKKYKHLNRALNIYLKNGEGRPRCGKGWSDFFYVPGHLASTCQKLLEIYERNKLFLEMAVMNVLHSLDLKKNFVIVKGIFLPDLWLQNPADGREFWGVYNSSIPFIHPFKYGYKDYASMNKALVKHWILEITNSLTSC